MAEVLFLITDVLAVLQFLWIRVPFTLCSRDVARVVTPRLVCGSGTVNAGLFITIQQRFHLWLVMEFASSYRTVLT